jgi:hypothetical protein
MARFNLDIDYPLDKMEISRRRMEARNQFRYIDRVPVLYGLFARYFAPLFNLPALSEKRLTLRGQGHQAFGQLGDFARKSPEGGNGR